MVERGEHERVARAYRRYARSDRKRRAWARDNPGNVATRAELVDAVLELAAVPLGRAGPVLDAGCGTGWLLRALAERGVAPRRLHGVDLLEERLSDAEVPAGVTLRTADVRALPFANRHFDLVLLFAVLSSLVNREAVLRALGEAVRVAAAGGLVVCWEPRVPTPGNRRTRLVRMAEFRAGLGGQVETRPITIWPPLARRLGARANRVYPRLGTLPGTRSHRLVWRRIPDLGALRAHRRVYGDADLPDQGLHGSH